MFSWLVFSNYVEVPGFDSYKLYINEIILHDGEKQAIARSTP